MDWFLGLLALLYALAHHEGHFFACVDTFSSVRHNER